MKAAKERTSVVLLFFSQFFARLSSHHAYTIQASVTPDSAKSLSSFTYVTFSVAER